MPLGPTPPPPPTAPPTADGARVAGVMVVVVVVMGVSGSGKTTVGKALAAALGWLFVEGDDYHSPASIAKMAGGRPLEDDDRWPWLDDLRAVIDDALGRGRRLVMACSALKASYRTRLAGVEAGGRVRFVHLAGPSELFRVRMEQRVGHHMKAPMLDSQLATLEPPEDALEVDAALPVATLVSQIRAALGL
jgi:gluconokinase